MRRVGIRLLGLWGLGFILSLGFGFDLVFLYPSSVQAVRLKDISSIRGVRENQILGYGVVVGLKGTGDGKSEFTAKSLGRMLDKLGIKLDNPQVESKNVAGVVVTATLPQFARSGNPIDVTVSSLGDASSLEGGTLLQTPLRAANDEVFAVAQGSISLGGLGKDGHPTVGRIPNGALIERDGAGDFSSNKIYRLTLHQPDFLTAARAAIAINRELSGQYATARDGGTVDIITPFSYEGKGVNLLALVELVEVNPDIKAKVVINERTGTVIIGEKVKLSRIAIAHGNLSIKILSGSGGNGSGGKGSSGIAPIGSGSSGNSKESSKNGKSQVTSEEKVVVFDSGVSVGDLVQSLNKLGISPKDLIALLQSMKAAGALHGDLEIL